MTQAKNMAQAKILDHRGNPMSPPSKEVLSTERAGPTLTGVRSPVTGYPANGLTPDRLATILRDADQGNPLAFLELAEQIEERDLHYAGIMSTRKRSVSQLDISVEAASDSAAHEEQAERVRLWLKRDELAQELFDILDAVGKGFSITEIIWDISLRQYQPARLEWRDPRWFRFDRRDGCTPMLIGDGGQEEELAPFKFIYTVMRAKSGLPIRSGIARLAVWAWMFKAYTNRDWTIFTQTYGQPIRVGTYNRGATPEQKETLYQAVANIAGDCAAIIPEGMKIDFIETKSPSSNSSLYKDRADWLDQQMSKAVLGQTATTDAIAGGHAVGQEHRQVQEDIERADAAMLAAILNRDLIRPWMMLDYGESKDFPRLKIGRADKEDVDQLMSAVSWLVPLGFRVKQSEVREKLNLSEPAEGDEILSVAEVGATGKGKSPSPPKATRPPRSRATSLQAQSSNPAVPSSTPNPLSSPPQAPVDEMLEQIASAVANATSLEDLRDRLNSLKTDMDTAAFANAVRDAMLEANLEGRLEFKKAR